MYVGPYLLLVGVLYIGKLAGSYTVACITCIAILVPGVPVVLNSLLLLVPLHLEMALIDRQQPYRFLKGKMSIQVKSIETKHIENIMITKHLHYVVEDSDAPGCGARRCC